MQQEGLDSALVAIQACDRQKYQPTKRPFLLGYRHFGEYDAGWCGREAEWIVLQGSVLIKFISLIGLKFLSEVLDNTANYMRHLSADQLARAG
jgi:hypothetical protein